MARRVGGFVSASAHAARRAAEEALLPGITALAGLRFGIVGLVAVAFGCSAAYLAYCVAKPRQKDRHVVVEEGSDTVPSQVWDAVRRLAPDGSMAVATRDDGWGSGEGFAVRADKLRLVLLVPRRLWLFDPESAEAEQAHIDVQIAHELGHVRLRHRRATVVWGFAANTALFAAAGAAVVAALAILAALGAWPASGGPAGLAGAAVLAVVLATAPGAALIPVSAAMAWLSRRHELAADRYAARMTSPASLSACLSAEIDEKELDRRSWELLDLCFACVPPVEERLRNSLVGAGTPSRLTRAGRVALFERIEREIERVDPSARARWEADGEREEGKTSARLRRAWGRLTASHPTLAERLSAASN